jgi:hypothetical protein
VAGETVWKSSAVNMGAPSDVDVGDQTAIGRAGTASGSLP